MANWGERSSSHTKNGKTRRVGTSSEDRISGLPDEIILCILSLLTMKEAGRTSVLSKRWRYAWTSIPILNFYDSRILDDLMSHKRKLKVEKPLFIGWVNQVLRSYQGGAIHELRVQFGLDESERAFIDDWVKFATEKGVKRLELDLTDLEFEPDLTSVGIYQGRFYTFPTFYNCNSLTSLQLKYVNITGEVIQYYLQNCLSLEYLSVEGSKALVNLKIEGNSLQLKSLKIINCDDIKSIEISAPNLVSFKYFGSKISLPFVSTPKLVDVSIGGTYRKRFTSTLSELSSSLSQLEALRLDFNGFFENRMKSFESPLCARLRRLQLRVCSLDDEDIPCFGSLIKACPVLDKLRLELSRRLWKRAKFTEWWLKEASCPHHLKVVECVGFHDNGFNIKLVLYLIVNAVALEKLVIQTCTPSLVGAELEFEETREIRRSKIRAELFRGMLKPGVTLAIS